MKKIYIWGAGKYGVLAAFDCEQKGVKVTGFIDRDAERVKTRLGLPVLTLSNIIAENPYIIIAVKNDNAVKEIKEYLIKNKFEFEIWQKIQEYSKYLIIKDYKYVSKHRDSLKHSKIGKIIEEWYNINKSEITELIKNFCLFKEFYKKIPLISNEESTLQWNNRFIQPFDSISIYSFLALNNPRYYVEVGSGNSTMFAAQAIKDNNLRTKIISIDPCPREEINKLCHKVYRMPFENMELDFFKALTSEDILLIDNSHRSFPNSDVTVFFTEVLPELPKGMLYALHDIFLPFDYPPKWLHSQLRWYNEQYLLCTYILAGMNGDKIVCPNAFLTTQKEIFDICNPLWGKEGLFEGLPIEGRFGDLGGLVSFFWLRKG